MVGFRDFDGVGIAPVSNKLAVKVIIQVRAGQQASSMHSRHGTSLLSTPLPFLTCIITFGK